MQTNGAEQGNDDSSLPALPTHPLTRCRLRCGKRKGTYTQSTAPWSQVPRTLCLLATQASSPTTPPSFFFFLAVPSYTHTPCPCPCYSAPCHALPCLLPPRQTHIHEYIRHSVPSPHDCSTRIYFKPSSANNTLQIRLSDINISASTHHYNQSSNHSTQLLYNAAHHHSSTNHISKMPAQRPSHLPPCPGPPPSRPLPPLPKSH